MVNSTAPHLLYVSDVFPAPPSGGSVIIYRHLHRLVQDGWRVTIAAPAPAFRPLPDGHGFGCARCPGKAGGRPRAPHGRSPNGSARGCGQQAMRSDPKLGQAATRRHHPHRPVGSHFAYSHATQPGLARAARRQGAGFVSRDVTARRALRGAQPAKNLCAPCCAMRLPARLDRLRRNARAARVTLPARLCPHAHGHARTERRARRRLACSLPRRSCHRACAPHFMRTTSNTCSRRWHALRPNAAARCSCSRRPTTRRWPRLRATGTTFRHQPLASARVRRRCVFSPPKPAHSR